MSQYGVRRLIAINSGNYQFANIDLSKPVHLAAPNNCGKSTLVNALQFLYVDDFAKMRFGRRSHEDTRQHYFGGDRSYLVFECQTTTGIQCMLVRGLSSLRGGQFERFVYDKEFSEADYIEDSEIRSFDSVKTRLADRHLVQVKNAELWQVLAGNLPSDNGKEIPRFNILPIRRRDEYTAFRDVFVRLLSMTNADAGALRRLIIDSHARDVGERKIDVAAEYKDEFERAERSEHQLRFIRAVADDIDLGREYRLELRALGDKFAAAAPQLWSDAVRCRHFLDAEKTRLDALAMTLERAQVETRNRKEAALRECGKRQALMEAIESERSKLVTAHEKWSTSSAEFIKQMRTNCERLAAEIRVQERYLEQAAVLDLDAMRRRVEQLKHDLAVDRKAVEQWEQTVVAELRRAGIPIGDIESAFHIANPSLLMQIVGDAVTITDLNLTLARIGTIASRVKDGTYADEAMETNLSKIRGPNVTELCDVANLRNKIAITEHELSQQASRLKVAEDQNQARALLESLRSEYASRLGELTDYDQYAHAWSQRDDVENRLADAKQAISDTDRAIAEAERELKTQSKEQGRIEQACDALEQAQEQLTRLASDVRQAAQRLRLDNSLPSETCQDEDESSFPKSLERFAERVAGKLAGLVADLNRIDAGRSQLKECQDRIATKSRQFESQERYFNDEDDEWDLLIEGHESLLQLETATSKSWDALFTMLGARLNAVVTAVSSIRTAVDRLNRGLRAYQVSNLRSVEIKVQEQHDTFSTVEALASQGSLFQDKDQLDSSKKKLRQLIDSNQTIDLESLFELRIRIQQSGGAWLEAKSLDEIGSTGTGMTAKAMIFIQLIRAIAANEKYRLHFYIDGLGELDDCNLRATAAMAVSKGVIPITADPRLHLEPLAHPEVTVYGLGQSEEGRFCIDSYKTYHAHRRTQPVGTGHE